MQDHCRRIGEAAGKIHQALEKGGSSLEALAREAQLNDAVLFNQAIGWLCREDKLKFEKVGTSLEVYLATSSLDTWSK